MIFVPLLFMAGALIGKKMIVGALVVGMAEKAARVKLERQYRVNPTREEEVFTLGGEAALIEVRLDGAYLEKCKLPGAEPELRKYFGVYRLSPLEAGGFRQDIRKIASAYDVWGEKQGDEEGKRLLWLKELTRRRKAA
jgi:hypothetical protein